MALCRVCSSLGPIWGVAREAERLSWRETGQLAGGVVMNKMGSGAVDGVAGCE